MPQYNSLNFHLFTDAVRNVASQKTIPTCTIRTGTLLYRGTPRLALGNQIDPHGFLKPHDPSRNNRFTGAGSTSAAYFSTAEKTIPAELQRGWWWRSNLHRIAWNTTICVVRTTRPAKVANFSVNSEDAQEFLRTVASDATVRDRLEKVGFHRDGFIDAFLHQKAHDVGIGLGLAAADKKLAGVLSTSAKYEPLGSLWNTNVALFGKKGFDVPGVELVELRERTKEEVITTPLSGFCHSIELFVSRDEYPMEP